MKLSLAILSLLSSSTSLMTVGVMALQGNSYLSQLGTSGGGGSTATTASSLTSTSFFPAPASTVGGSSAMMADLYSSGPPGAVMSNGRTGSTTSTSYSSSSSTPQQQQQQQQLLLIELWSNQVSVELAASQLYLSASIWFRTHNMDGMAAWMLDESGEERGHGLSILEFAMKKGIPVTLQPLVAPKNDWSNPLQVWESILDAEQTNTKNLLQLASIANECGEYAACAFLDPFHLEQLDAEDKVGKIVNTVRGATTQLLVQLDYDLGKQAEEEAAEEDHHHH